MDVLSIHFINTNWYTTHRDCKDLLEDDAWLKTFQKRWHIETALPPNAEELVRLKALRSFLEEAVHAVLREEKLNQSQIETLNSYLALCPLNRSIEMEDGIYTTAVKPLTKDWNWVLYEIAASFAGLISQQDTKRLKYCENPECQWVFLDESKSRTKRWCCNTCASLIKVRKFREKAAAKG